MPHILNFTRNELADFMEEVGHERYRAEQIMRWIYHQKITNFEQMVNIPKVMRKQLSRQLVFTEPEIQSEHISRCGTIKWLIGCDKKNAVETVYIPEAKRATLCISSQVGCARSATRFVTVFVIAVTAVSCTDVAR